MRLRFCTVHEMHYDRGGIESAGKWKLKKVRELFRMDPLASIKALMPVMGCSYGIFPLFLRHTCLIIRSTSALFMVGRAWYFLRIFVYLVLVSFVFVVSKISSSVSLLLPSAHLNASVSLLTGCIDLRSLKHY